MRKATPKSSFKDKHAKCKSCGADIVFVNKAFHGARVIDPRPVNLIGRKTHTCSMTACRELSKEEIDKMNEKLREK